MIPEIPVIVRNLPCAGCGIVKRHLARLTGGLVETCSVEPLAFPARVGYGVPTATGADDRRTPT